MPRSPDSDPQPVAAGALLALFTVIGAIGGAVAGQVTIGIFAGVLLGAGLAIVIWLRDRKRIGR